MVAIRLMRMGKKGRPAFRIVVQDGRRKNAGACLETLGAWDPKGQGGINVKLDRVKVWRARGATVSPTVQSLLKRAAAG